MGCGRGFAGDLHTGSCVLTVHRYKIVHEKGENLMALTFEQVVETIRQFPAEQQEMLIDLMQNWRIESRRREMARDAQESLAAFRSGQLKP